MYTPNWHAASCDHCTFAPFCINEDDTEEVQQFNRAVKQTRKLQRNEVLFLPRNKFQSLYIIQQGALKTYQTEADGKELVRGFYFETEILGYEAICTGHYLFAAVALTDTIVCEITYTRFLSLMQDKPELQKSILHLISQELNVRSYLLLSSAEQRLAAFLIDLSSRLSPNKINYYLTLPMSRQDIGNYLRLTGETVSRVLSRFQRKRIIKIDHKKISLLQPDLLQTIADGYLAE